MATTYAIPDGRVAMAATLFTGNGATQTISNAVNGVSFQPDFVWEKSRSTAYQHYLYDSVRGAGYYLVSNATAAEVANSNTLASFNSNGFTLNSGSGTPGGVNDSGATFVGWQWKAGGTAVSNTAGSITSSVSANTTAGFSVVTYTGTGANATVGHGLGVAPSMVIVKCRGTAAREWPVYHSSLTSAAYAVFLNQTSAQASLPTIWNSTAPTSTVFSLGNSGQSNEASTMVAYCFAPVAGYSAFGSYTGNGSADGPFVYLGFRPRFVMIKSSTAVTSWEIWDTSRDTYNTMNAELYPNLSIAETNATTNNRPIDSVSNGFKIRGTDAQVNTSGQTYIYACFAENPFKYANAR